MQTLLGLMQETIHTLLVSSAFAPLAGLIELQNTEAKSSTHRTLTTPDQSPQAVRLCSDTEEITSR